MSNAHRRQPHVGHRADPRRGADARPRPCSRSTSGCCPGWSTRSARSCSCSATSAATSSTATARCTRSATAGARWPRRTPTCAVVANASDPHVVWAGDAGQDHVGRARAAAGAPTPPRARTAPRCSSWSADRFDCPSCGFAQPATPNRLDGDTLVLDGTRMPLRLALPGRWNRANAALAVTAAIDALRRRSRRRRRRGGDGRPRSRAGT